MRGVLSDDELRRLHASIDAHRGEIKERNEALRNTSDSPRDVWESSSAENLEVRYPEMERRGDEIWVAC